MSGAIYLTSYLAPLAELLARADVTDLYVNRPGEAWVETLGGAIEAHALPALTETVLGRLSRQIAALTHQGISREHPLLAATLPDGARVQIAAPPATRGATAVAIRKHLVPDLQLSDYAADGAFADTASAPADAAINERLRTLLDERRFPEALSVAVKARKNVLVSGGTSTGKTTFLNALLREVPPAERLILIEDTPELHVTQPNVVGLLATRSALGEARVTANELVSASLRMRPDRVILGELRGDEAFAFLRAINTGHPGSMTTIHADSPRSAVEQLVLLVLQAGTQLTRDDVHHYVTSTIDLFVQLDRVGGKRHVAEVSFVERDTA